MRVILIADIHGNLPALESVLSDAGKRGVDNIWGLGDLAGYCPYPNEVVERLQKEQVRTICGNYDTKILEFKKKKSKWKKKKDPVKFFSLRWTYKNISKNTKRYLKRLPERLILKEEDKKFIFVHGTFDADDEPLKPDTPRGRFSELAGKTGADAVLCGHSHLFMDKTVDGVRFINPGSVGRPFDGDPRASYAVLDIEKGKLSVKNIRVAYKMDAMLKKMRNEGFPQELLQAVREGKSLDPGTRAPNQSPLGMVQGKPCAVRGKHEVKSINRKDLIKQVLKLAESCDYEKEHSHQVGRTALQLFDSLKSLHGLDSRIERVLLESAGLLHDIGLASIRPALPASQRGERGRRSGLSKGTRKHHKTGRDIILNSKNLPLSEEEKMITALIVRYHRRALPKKSHKYYSSLTRVSRDVVNKLSSLLRIADGLDRTHLSMVKYLNCRILPEKVVIQIKAKEFSGPDKEFGKRKADLFEKVFKKELLINWR
ncbi:MAG: YfcE family phosphodiesterase [Elusimicrobia bacterium]|nr:YfcE family phosphodiesterase [Elusimicrobiota bacterium]